MANINIGIIDPAQSSKTTMVVSNDVPVGDLTEAMVETMELPFTGNNGLSLRYQLNVRGDDGRLTRLSENHTLEQSGVQDDAVLQLSVEMTPVEKNHKKSIKDTLFGVFSKQKKEITRDVVQNSNGIPVNLDVYHFNQHQVSIQGLSLNTSVPVWLLISQLTRQLDLPAHDSSGNSLIYHLERGDYSVPIDQRQLDFFDTLENQDIQVNTNLILSGMPVQVARLKQVLNTKVPDTGNRRLANRSSRLENSHLVEYSKDMRYLFNDRDLSAMVKEQLQEQKSDVKTLEKIDKTIELIYAMLSQSQKLSGDALNFESYMNELQTVSAMVKNQGISIVVRSPEKIQANSQFSIYLEISVLLDDLGWMWLSRKDPMIFDVVSYTPDTIEGLSTFQFTGTNSRHISLPMEPGEHRITTTFQMRSKQIGQFPIHFDIFQEGRYFNTLMIEIHAQMESIIEENDPQSRTKTTVLRQSSGQRTIT